MIDKILPIKTYSDEDKKRCFNDLGFTPKNEYMVIFKNKKRIRKHMHLDLEEVNKIVKIFDISEMRGRTVVWCCEVENLR